MQQECKCPKCGTTVNAVPQEPEYLTAAAFKGGVLGGIAAGLIAVALTVAARYLGAG